MEFFRDRSILNHHSTPSKSWRRWLDVTILIFINFVNYTDRYNLAGVLIDLQEYFHITDDKAGLIQTIFTIAYMTTAPLFGFLGDRYNRKILLAFSVIMWNTGNIICSFVSSFWLFLLFRTFLGIGQACYTTVAPSILSDLFVGQTRSQLLAIFYTAIPMGNGIGNIVGTRMAAAFGSWKWSLRATPFIAIPNVVLLLVVLQNPRTGEIEGSTMETTSCTADVKYLLTNPSFMFSTLGFTAVAFTSGAITWWAPKLNYLGFRLKDPDVDSHKEGSIFGFVTLFSGFFGLLFGYLFTFKFKETYPQIDPIVCGVGLVISGPFYIWATYASKTDKVLCYCLHFIGFVFMNLNWALTMDICIRVVVPWRRASAIGMQLLVGHGLGDVESPYLVGLFSDLLFEHYESRGQDKMNQFRALQYAFFVGCAVEILGSFFFFMNAVYLVRDMEKMSRDSAEVTQEVNV